MRNYASEVQFCEQYKDQLLAYLTIAMMSVISTPGANKRAT